MLPKVDLNGVLISNGSLAEIVREVGDAVRRRGDPLTLVAVNAHTYSEAQKNPAYRQALNEASIAWPDGTPIKWAARLQGRLLGPRIHGHDLMVRLLQEPLRHYFYGSTPGTLDRMRDRLRGVHIAGTEAPPLTRRAERSEVSRINESGADILWVALGAPKQELWAALNRDQIRIPVVACVGAAFDILAGRFSRAPKLLQTAGLEWAWRLGQDPARLWRRYFSTNGYFVAHVLKCWLAGSFPQ